MVAAQSLLPSDPMSRYKSEPGPEVRMGILPSAVGFSLRILFRSSIGRCCYTYLIASALSSPSSVTTIQSTIYAGCTRPVLTVKLNNVGRLSAPPHVSSRPGTSESLYITDPQWQACDEFCILWHFVHTILETQNSTRVAEDTHFIRK